MKKNDGEIWVSSEDTHAFLNYCICGFALSSLGSSVSDAWITRCPKCGRGYRSEFVVWIYDPNEKDKDYLDKDEFDKKLEETRKFLYDQGYTQFGKPNAN